jgi:hypothetical protein
MTSIVDKNRLSINGEQPRGPAGQGNAREDGCIGLHFFERGEALGLEGVTGRHGRSWRQTMRDSKKKQQGTGKYWMSEVCACLCGPARESRDKGRKLLSISGWQLYVKRVSGKLF